MYLFFLMDAYSSICAVDTECFCIVQVSVTLQTVR
jgi:hypothetical protein